MGHGDSSEHPTQADGLSNPPEEAASHQTYLAFSLGGHLLEARAWRLWHPMQFHLTPRKRLSKTYWSSWKPPTRWLSSPALERSEEHTSELQSRRDLVC